MPVINSLKTVFLLGILTAFLLAIGFFFGGIIGLTIGLIIAFGINFISYWFSDRIVLWMYKARPLRDSTINSIVEKLAKKAGIPKPKTYLVEMDIPNAFATGRSPKNSAVAITTGLMNELSTNEIEGVLSHEISHITHRDTLVGTVAATIAGALTWLAYIFWFGSGDENKNIVSYLILFIMAPIAAMLIRLAITRNREYFADRGGAELANPLDLASALEKIGAYAKAKPARHGNPSTSHLFIVNPFSGKAVMNLFSTHPPIEDRVRILKDIAKNR